MFGSLNWDFVLRFLNITLIDLALSGDNAIVIAMAAAALPRYRRKWVIIIGGAGAIGLRIFLTSIVSILMLLPFLSAVGGIVLVWVAYKLLKLDFAGDKDNKKSREAKTFRQAIFLIVVADFMMSLDNVIAVAGSAHGNVTLLAAGLLISMPLLMATGGWISLLVDKFKWLVFVGAFVIVFTATRMVFEDKFIAVRFPEPTSVVLTAAALVGLMVTTFFVWLNKQQEKAQANSPVSIRDDENSRD